MNIKIGSMYYNKDKDHVATITNHTGKFIEYQWKRVDGKSLIGYMLGASGKCKVTMPEFKYYIKNRMLTELSPLHIFEDQHEDYCATYDNDECDCNPVRDNQWEPEDE